ncbi:unnamed protein product [Amoebophrya sp. A120]|nr:unnamed protein product [Amoebophrya sp. A120]|eukprot:GSA120T00021577001.1
MLPSTNFSAALSEAPPLDDKAAESSTQAQNKSAILPEDAWIAKLNEDRKNAYFKFEWIWSASPPPVDATNKISSAAGQQAPSGAAAEHVDRSKKRKRDDQEAGTVDDHRNGDTKKKKREKGKDGAAVVLAGAGDDGGENAAAKKRKHSKKERKDSSANIKDGSDSDADEKRKKKKKGKKAASSDEEDSEDSADSSASSSSDRKRASSSSSNASDSDVASSKNSSDDSDEDDSNGSDSGSEVDLDPRLLPKVLDWREKESVTAEEALEARKPGNNSGKSKGSNQSGAVAGAGGNAAEDDESDSSDLENPGPQMSREEREIQSQSFNYGHALLPGEGAAMAQFVQNKQRIPRRGEVGISHEQIEGLENLGYVMSGSRHKRMNAVRLRKENQIYTAEEQRALALFNYEEKQEKEKETIAGLKDMLSKRQEEIHDEKTAIDQLAKSFGKAD